MTEGEVVKMFYMVKAAYPRVYKDFGKTETDNFIAAWCMVFKDIPATDAFAGLKTYLSTEKTGFPPSPGQIMDCVHRLKPDDLPNEMEAWTLVDKAVRNSNYNAVEEFEKLPQVVKRAVRNPARLREWAQMDLDTYQTVEQSNFMRVYRAEAERERNNAKIPQDIRPVIEMITTPQMIEEKRQELKEGTNAPTEEIDALIEKLKGAAL